MDSARERWNEKFEQILSKRSAPEVPDWVKTHVVGGPEPLIDLACGTAVSLRWWVDRGNAGVGVDVADRVLNKLREENPNLPLIQANLETTIPFIFPRATYLVRFFYGPELMNQIARNAAPGSRVLIETYVAVNEGEEPINPDYCLEPNELAERFHGWEVEYHEEDTQQHPEVARLVADKPPTR